LTKGATRSPVERVDCAVGDSLRRAGVLKQGDTVVVAVSGGADSLCLLYALHRLSSELQCSLHVAHLDHMLRGSESQQDAEFVAAQAQALGLPRTVDARDVAAYRVARKCSLEEAAREVRYAFLREVASGAGARVVLTGHNRDDAVETIMLHILRGSGVHGLRGLELVAAYPSTAEERATPGAPVLVRPLLRVSRREAKEYCDALGLEPREDASNDSTEYLRNRIRSELIPSMRELNPRVDEALLRLSSVAAEDDEQLMRMTRERWEALVTVSSDSVSIELSGFLESTPAIQSRLVLLAMVHLNGCVRDVSSEHVSAVRDIALNSVGKQVDLPSGIVWRREASNLTALRRHPPEALDIAAMPIDPVALPIPGQVELPAGRITARAAVPDEVMESRDPFVVYVDRAATGSAMLVRRRRPGDRFRPLGMQDDKKLQDFMVDAHIAVGVRDRVPIVCSPAGIVWVAGWRIDERVKVTPDTRSVVRLEFTPAG
jgi:tRNA(Ile)-lysidine synthase